MREVLEQIISAGVLAPSGDNCQPWQFKARDNQIEIFNLPERDQSLYSWGQRASLVAHGALLENLALAAGQQGYRAEIALLPDPGQPDLVARVTLIPAPAQKDDALYQAIFKRATNRKPYDKQPLTTTQRAALLHLGEDLPEIQLKLVEDLAQRKSLARVASTNETILFENRAMHSFFFSHLNWTAQEDATRQMGMSIKTLEVPPPVQMAFRVFRRWGPLQILNVLGLSKMVALGNGQLYATGAAIGALVLPDRSAPSYLEAGRLFERIWLWATSVGLALQPLTGIFLLMNRVVAGETQDLSPEHIELIAQKYNQASQILETGEQPLALMFRLGQAAPASVRTHRLKPAITWT